MAVRRGSWPRRGSAGRRSAPARRSSSARSARRRAARGRPRSSSRSALNGRSSSSSRQSAAAYSTAAQRGRGTGRRPRRPAPGRAARAKMSLGTVASTRVVAAPRPRRRSARGSWPRRKESGAPGVTRSPRRARDSRAAGPVDQHPAARARSTDRASAANSGSHDAARVAQALLARVLAADGAPQPQLAPQPHHRHLVGARAELPAQQRPPHLRPRLASHPALDPRAGGHALERRRVAGEALQRDAPPRPAARARRATAAGSAAGRAAW